MTGNYPRNLTVSNILTPYRRTWLKLIAWSAAGVTRVKTLMVSIKMSNNERSLEPLGTVINGQKARPKDATFLSGSLRSFLCITS